MRAEGEQRAPCTIDHASIRTAIALSRGQCLTCSAEPDEFSLRETLSVGTRRVSGRQRAKRSGCRTIPVSRTRGKDGRRLGAGQRPAARGLIFDGPFKEVASDRGIVDRDLDAQVAARCLPLRLG